MIRPVTEFMLDLFRALLIDEFARHVRGGVNHALYLVRCQKSRRRHSKRATRALRGLSTAPPQKAR